MSILRIPSLKKMYGTMNFAIDQTTGQLYKIGDLDVTPINLFGGIPDEDFHDQGTGSMRSLLKTPQAMSTPITEVPKNVPTGSMRSLLKTPQAMSTPITEVPKNVPTELIMKDSIPLPTSRIPTTSLKEKTLMSDTDVTDDVPATASIFNLNRANVQAASSVSSLDEGEGIINNDEYERAIQRLEKINKKITTLVKNRNEESKLAKNSNEVVEIKEFYRPYMDQYNTRQKALERLMEMYDENCINTVPMETPQQKHMTMLQLPHSTSPAKQTPFQETIEMFSMGESRQITTLDQKKLV